MSISMPPDINSEIDSGIDSDSEKDENFCDEEVNIGTITSVDGREIIDAEYAAVSLHYIIPNIEVQKYDTILGAS